MRVVIVGASRGIGLEFVRQYQAAGARVVAGCRNPSAAGALRDIAKTSAGHVIVEALDIADGASVVRFAGALASGPIDLVLISAGTAGPENQHLLGALDFDRWAETFATNTIGPVRIADALRANLVATPGSKLVALTSGLGRTSQPGGDYLAYRASKAALNNAWANLALALRPEGVICTLLSPGWVKTDMGGEKADLTPGESVTALRAKIETLTMEDSGRYFAWGGLEQPW
ncbi:MAG TPA: SDR family oxidoreductase [Caulobacteraceae bacterium]|nr:SDR family oxidoreductase [Caulobacteraceae bacterium]